jgi:anti-sigma factor RsiW
MSSPTGTDGHDAFYEDAAAYVLGALTDEEHGRFTVHLEGCGACREEVARLQVAADALPLAAPQLPAPPELRQRVMLAVGGGAGERDTGEAPEARFMPADAAEPRVGRPRRARASWGARRSPRRWSLGATGALAAAAIVLALIALVGSGGGASSRVVRAQVLAHGATASLRVSGSRAELLVNGMPQVPARRTYQVWVERGGAPQPTDALFSVSGSGGATVAVPGGIAGVKAVLVTAEPLGGSRTPTLPVLIDARLG